MTVISRNYTLIRSLKILTKIDRWKLYAVLVFQVLIAGLDLAGVALVGILGTLAVSGISSQSSSPEIANIFKVFGISDLTIQHQTLIVGLMAAFLLLGKTLLSMFIIRKLIFFLSRRSAVVTSELLTRLLEEPLTTIQKYSKQHLLYILTSGVYTATVGILGTSIQIFTDLALLVVLFVGILVINPPVAFISLIMFSVIGSLLYSKMKNHMRELGAKDYELSILSNQKIVDLFSSIREIYVRNGQSTQIKKISKIRSELSDIQADMNFIPSVSKYVIEITVVLMTFVISALQFYLFDAKSAVTTLALFLAATTRIAPAVLRLHQNSLFIKGSIGTTSQALDFLENLPKNVLKDENIFLDNTQHDGFTALIEIKNVTYSYPGMSQNVINDVTLEISPGEFIAVVGPTASGKSTLIDLLIGILIPDAGSIRISGKPPREAVKIWPGAIGYVPQEINLNDGTIEENLMLGIENVENKYELIKEALSIASLDEFTLQSNNNLKHSKGENGPKLSGGQRQRLGIARAMLTKPKLVIFDEATSALDAQTEVEVSNAIQKLKGHVTLVMIAHRLSTIRNADKIVYFDNGRVQAIGTFQEVRKEIPDFEIQAQLMGL